MSNLNTALAKPKETLTFHTDNCLSVARLLLEQNSDILQKFVDKLPSDFFIRGEPNYSELEKFVSSLVEYHDKGKLNPKYQKFIENPDKNRHIDKKERSHSLYSFLFWVKDYIKDNPLPIDKKSIEYDSYMKHIFLLCSISFPVINGHHGRMSNFVEEVFREEKILKVSYKNKVNELFSTTEGFSIYEKYDVFSFLKELKKFWSKNINPPSSKYHTVSNDWMLSFSKYCYSILIRSDSVASSSFSKDEYSSIFNEIFNRDILSPNAPDDFVASYNNSNIAKNISKSPLKPTDDFSDPNSVKNLNDLRTLANMKITSSVDDTGIYIIESPVGTGKTFSSLSLAKEIAMHHKKKKLINVFPLNSVQSQYSNTLKNELNISDEMMNIVNSQDVHGITKNNDDNLLSQDTVLRNDNLWLFKRESFSNEIIITSHVRFFESLSCTTRNSALSFLSLKDSVIVIDEFQNYSEKYWTHIWNELLKIHELFGTVFIFTSGTFPVPDTQIKVFAPKVKKVFSTSDRHKLFNSQFIKDRCEISSFSDVSYNNIELLSEKLIDRIHQVEKDGHNQFIICMNYVNSTKRLWTLIKDIFEPQGYQVYYLCGRHQKKYKKNLLDTIQKHNENPNDKVILVTTKTVECGMDFDFDYGFKELDRFDSVEQLSGRVNRHGKKNTATKKSKVEIFEFERRKNNEEKFLSSDLVIDDLVSNINNKNFPYLFDRSYNQNMVDLSLAKDEMNDIHRYLTYDRYRSIMRVIDDSDYLQTIYLPFPNQVNTFLNKINNFTKTNDFATDKKNGMILKNSIQPYEITVTTNWLFDMIKNNWLYLDDNSYFPFFKISDDSFDFFNCFCIETFVFEKHTGFIESEKYKKQEESSYEIF